MGASGPEPSAPGAGAAKPPRHRGECSFAGRRLRPTPSSASAPPTASLGLFRVGSGRLGKGRANSSGAIASARALGAEARTVGRGSVGLGRGSKTRCAALGPRAAGWPPGFQWAGMFPRCSVLCSGAGGGCSGGRTPGPLGLGGQPAFRSQGAFPGGGVASGGRGAVEFPGWAAAGHQGNPWIPAPALPPEPHASGVVSQSLWASLSSSTKWR